MTSPRRLSAAPRRRPARSSPDHCKRVRRGAGRSDDAVTRNRRCIYRVYPQKPGVTRLKTPPDAGAERPRSPCRKNGQRSSRGNGAQSRKCAGRSRPAARLELFPIRSHLIRRPRESGGPGTPFTARPLFMPGASSGFPLTRERRSNLVGNRSSPRESSRLQVKGIDNRAEAAPLHSGREVECRLAGLQVRRHGYVFVNHAPLAGDLAVDVGYPQP
jgi:hypothetical protein